MRIIAIAENEHGYHENQFRQHVSELPEGWALIPEGTVYPESFPFVRLTVEGHTVTAMEPVTLPAPAPVSRPENPEADTIEAVLDHEVRLIQLELGTDTTK